MGIDPATPRLLSLFMMCFQCTTKDPQARRKRDELFLRFAPSGKGYLSLSDVCAGTKALLMSEHGKEGVQLYHRYYRSYIRAFHDAKDAAAARPGRPSDDAFVTKSEVALTHQPSPRMRMRPPLATTQFTFVHHYSFLYVQFRLLIVYLGVYATLYEVFAHLIDVDRSFSIWGSPEAKSTRTEQDYKMTREEWIASIERVRKAGRSWAPYVRLRSAHAADFDEMDHDRAGLVEFRQFCDFVEAAEKLAGTPIGMDLGAHELAEKPYAMHIDVPAANNYSLQHYARGEGQLNSASDEQLVRIMRRW
eukprot:CAMPEP_0115873882 /NCGR_PEP_ID=MMETSP0287-20121206/24235_1 /TAXON_ID=412157 /ORGANISM="Chrysochromulina rotalis, Strain UIO044" /LENGTH=304 /DNA_ID=CAMNT_0003328977 /DNA_START=24 /DNA_END=935 /DNA_ORIENTATION=-